MPNKKILLADNLVWISLNYAVIVSTISEKVNDGETRQCAPTAWIVQIARLEKFLVATNELRLVQLAFVRPSVTIIWAVAVQSSRLHSQSKSCVPIMSAAGPQRQRLFVKSTVKTAPLAAHQAWLPYELPGKYRLINESAYLNRDVGNNLINLKVTQYTAMMSIIFHRKWIVTFSAFIIDSTKLIACNSLNTCKHSLISIVGSLASPSNL